ncbi:MAG: 4-hydroxybenzoate polyprenyltransferase, partial [Glaciecola sp.]
MVKYLDFIRWKNLAIILVMVFALKYWVFETLIVSTGFIQFTSTFTFIQTILLALSIMLVAAGGYVINDINDTVADRVNKSDQTLLLDILSEKQAHLLYFVLSLSGIGLATHIAISLGFYQLVFFHLVSAALLWLYSSYFKSSVLVGNIIVSVLSALVPLCYFCFETFSFISAYG